MYEVDTLSSAKKVLIIEENNAVPYDLRVWQEATTLRDAGWSVTVICPAMIGIDPDNKISGKASDTEDLEGITLHRFPMIFATGGITDYLAEFLLAFVAIMRLSWRVWRNNRFNIIHFCNPPDIFFPIAFFYRLLGARIIFDHHDLFPEFVAWRYRGAAGKLLYNIARLTEYLTFASANMILSTNETYRRIAVRRGRVPEDRVIVVRNGPKRDQFLPVEPVPALKRNFPYSVCYAGVMGYEDGVKELIQSIRYVVQDLGRQDILFVLLGNGAMYPKALEEVNAWGLNDIVVMPGMIHDKLLLRQYLCTADILLSPEPLTPLNKCSTFIKVAEYMTMGKPVIAYDLEETRYTAQEAAFYVEPGDTQAYGQAIVTLLDNKELRDQMGKIGRRRVLEQFCWEKQEEHLLRAYTITMGEE